MSCILPTNNNTSSKNNYQTQNHDKEQTDRFHVKIKEQTTIKAPTPKKPVSFSPNTKEMRKQAKTKACIAAMKGNDAGNRILKNKKNTALTTKTIQNNHDFMEDVSSKRKATNNNDIVPQPTKKHHTLSDDPVSDLDKNIDKIKTNPMQIENNNTTQKQKALDAKTKQENTPQLSPRVRQIINASQPSFQHPRVQDPNFQWPTFSFHIDQEENNPTKETVHEPIAIVQEPITTSPSLPKETRKPL